MVSQLPLSGVRVVDLADEKAELAGRLLADLGADVVRVEPPNGGVSRTLGPFHDGSSLYFAVRNANKRGTVLDLTDATDQPRFRELLGSADILLDTARPGARDSIGLGPEALRAEFPELVIVSITDFGLTGPYRDYVATDPVMVAMSWMLFRAGVPELPPVLPPGALAYDIAGITAAFAALTGYLQRLRTGAGLHIDLSVIESVQQTTDWGLASSSVISLMNPGGYSQIRAGGGQIYPIVPCKDGWVRPSMVTVAEWQKMRAWLGEPDMLQDDHWNLTSSRIEIYHDVIEPMLIELFADMTMIEASEEGQRRRIPITPLLRPRNVLEAEHYTSLGTFVEGSLTADISSRIASGFYQFDDDRVGFRSAAPEPSDTTTTDWTADPAPVPDIDGDPARGPYAGLRVLDFGIAGAAPEIARLLGEYGADVIRVESPHRPDLFRQMGGPIGISPVFASSNRTKRSFGVDFRQAEGIELIKQLVAVSDILVENLPPGTMEQYGISWDDLKAVNPNLVMFSSQTMGSRGPWKEWRGYGANTQPPGGMTYLWSFPDAPAPVASNVAFPDHVVGRLGATAAAALMIARERRSAGLHVEIVQSEVAINLLADLYAKEHLVPGSVEPVGNRSDRGFPWGVYQCDGEERWCVITCRDDRDWQQLVGALGQPEWATDPEFATVAGRREQADQIDAHLTEWTGQRSDREAMETLQAAGVPAGMMIYVGDIPDDPHFLARGYVLPLEQQGVGSMLVEGPSFHSSDLVGPITTPATRLGQESREVAGQILGLAEDEVDRLIAAGVLHDG